MIKELLGLRSHMVAHPSRCRIDGMVVVHPARRLRKVAASSVAYIVVEHDDARGTERVAQQALDFWVVNRLNLAGVIEVADCGRRFDQREAIAVQGELWPATPRVLD
jgi:hypothetical protein